MIENVNTSIEQVLYTMGDQIINTYRRKLSDGGTNASGLLGNSVSCIVQTNEGIYDLCLSLQDYWKYVEYGRQPGKFPPIEKIKEWITIKPVVPNIYSGKLPTTEQLSFLIARSIARNGIPAKNYLGSTLDEIREDTSLLEDGITKFIKGKVDLIFKDF